MVRKFLSLSLLLIIFLITLPGCYVGPGVTDYSYNLCGGYKLYKCSAHDIKVVPESGWDDNTPVIPTQVLSIAWDKQFIIATQQDIKENGKAASDKINIRIAFLLIPSRKNCFNYSFHTITYYFCYN